MGSIKEKIQGKIPGKIKRKEVTSDATAGVTSNLAKEESGKAGFFSVATAKRLAKKHIAAIIAVAVIGAGAGTVYGALQAQVEDLGENPVYGESEAKTQVLLEGKGYSLDKNQKKDYDLPQKLEKKKDNKLNKYNPITPRVYPNYSRGTYRFSGIRSSSYNSNKFKPSVTTNLRKLTKGETFAAGEKITFWVEGKTYSKANIKTKYYTVKSNGKKVKINESDSDTHAEYTITVPDPTDAKKSKKTGKYYFVVNVAVRDPLRKVPTSKSYAIYIKGGSKTETENTNDNNNNNNEEQNKNEPAPAPNNETVTVNASLTITGLSSAISGENISYDGGDTINLDPVTVDVPKGASKDAIEDAICKRFGISNEKISYPVSYKVSHEEGDDPNKPIVNDEGETIGYEPMIVTDPKTTTQLSGTFSSDAVSGGSGPVNCTFNVTGFN